MTVFTSNGDGPTADAQHAIDTATAASALDTLPDAETAGVVTSAVQTLPDAAKAGVATSALHSLSDDETANVVTTAMQTLPNDQKADVASAAMQALPATAQADLLERLSPDQAMTNDIWRWIVRTFAVVLIGAMAALVAAVIVSFWRKVDTTVLQMLLTIFTTTAGILAGFVSGRASSARRAT